MVLPDHYSKRYLKQVFFKKLSHGVNMQSNTGNKPPPHATGLDSRFLSSVFYIEVFKRKKKHKKRFQGSTSSSSTWKLIKTVLNETLQSFHTESLFGPK